MTYYPAPVHMGQFDAVRAGDIVDLYLEIAADLIAPEVIATVVFTVTDSAGAVVAGVVTAHTETTTRTDLRLAVPAVAGMYLLTAVFTISDGQKLTRLADLQVV
jgi:hypothetical protein